MMSIYVSNGLGLVLAEMILFGTNWRFKAMDLEYRLIRLMLIASIISCIVDPLVFYCDGREGTLCWAVVYFGNWWLYFGNMLIGPSWLYIIVRHLNGRVPKAQQAIVDLLCVIGAVVLLLNFFTPVVYTVDEQNVYHRAGLYWFYTGLQAFILVDGLVAYFYMRIKGGMLKFFPVFQFVIPIALAIAAQGSIYGISVVWPAIVISICGLLNSLRNEVLYIDALTGLYNRFYMEGVKGEIERSKNVSMTAMMLDMNDFKNINDKFGHAEGDVALMEAGRILRETVGPLGNAIRYAGDEFFILLNTKEQTIADACVKSIKDNVEKYNEVSGKEYRLSLSVGYCVFDKKNKTLDEVMHEIDRLMYLDKAEYYKTHKRIGERH